MRTARAFASRVFSGLRRSVVHSPRVSDALGELILRPGLGNNKASTAVFGAMVDIAPTDPIEGILVAQLMAANEAALSMYRRGWAQPPEYFTARTKYLQLADKAARTVLMLTERLDHHRGRGQQQITVKHVTTNNVTADQAIITDSVTTGRARNVASPALLAASSETPMPILTLQLLLWEMSESMGNHDSEVVDASSVD